MQGDCLELMKTIPDGALGAQIEPLKFEFRVDSRLLAPELNHRHRTIFESILKYQSKFEEHGLLPFETEAVNNGDARGVKYQKFALLNEDQCYS